MNIIFGWLNSLLQFIFSFTGDWGVTIIVLTVFVRALLVPMSIKQKESMQKSAEISKKMEEVKEKYKDDQAKLNEEMQKYYTQSAKSMLGCSVMILQMPVMLALFNVFTKMPAEVGTMLIPWVASLKMPDKYFIVPMVSILVQMLPNTLASLGIIKSSLVPKLSKSSIIMTVVLNVLFLVKAPISIGIYYIASSAFSFVEQWAYDLYLRHKTAGQSA